jgi:hypothetical protein
MSLPRARGCPWLIPMLIGNNHRRHHQGVPPIAWNVKENVVFLFVRSYYEFIFYIVLM